MVGRLAAAVRIGLPGFITFAPVSTLILDPEQISRRVERLSWQILESSQGHDSLWLAGVVGQGSLLAQALHRRLEELHPGKARLCRLDVDKKARSLPRVEIEDTTEADLADTLVVLVDDVLNSGRTLSYCMARLLAVPVGRLEVAVLVERSHRAYPIRASFSGLALSTTLEEHVEVRLEGDDQGVFLQ